ncbi:MAG: hypothetical protein ABR974_05115 [Bacteroidales bacterium]|jgi:hypothetical protein
MKLEITPDWILTEYSKNLPMLEYYGCDYDVVDDKFGWIVLTYVSESDCRWIELALNSLRIDFEKLKFDNTGEEPDQPYQYWYDVIINFSDILKNERELPNFVERLINWNYETNYAFHDWLMSR